MLKYVNISEQLLLVQHLELGKQLRNKKHDWLYSNIVVKCLKSLSPLV